MLLRMRHPDDQPPPGDDRVTVSSATDSTERRSVKGKHANRSRTNEIGKPWAYQTLLLPRGVKIRRDLFSDCFPEPANPRWDQPNERGSFSPSGPTSIAAGQSGEAAQDSRAQAVGRGRFPCALPPPAFSSCRATDGWADSRLFARPFRILICRWDRS